VTAAVAPVATPSAHKTWGASVLGLVAGSRLRRTPSDLVRLLLAAALVAVAVASVAHVSELEASIVGVVASLPGGLDPVWKVCLAMAPLLAVGLMVAALVARRFWLLLTQLVAAVVAWGVSEALSASVDVPGALADAGIDVADRSPEFPVIILAVSAAAVLASRPYLMRPSGRTAVAVLWLAALSALGLLEGLPTAVLGTMALAWGAAAAAHLALGSPAATPSPGEVADSLQALGVDATDLRLADDQTWGGANYLAGADARLSVRVVGRDSSDAHLLAKLWRSIWYKDSEQTLSLTRRDQVEHQAYVLLLARRTAAAVPDLVAAGLAGARDDAVLVVRNPAGQRLSDLDADQATDVILDGAWSNLASLHEARIAHGNPWAGNVVVDDDGTVGLIGVSDAVTGATDARLRLDRVQLLATTAATVGEDRALAAAERGLSPDDFVALLALLEPTALTPAAKRSLDHPKAFLADLRKAGAERTGVDPPELTELHRFPASAVFVAAAFAFGVYLLVAQLADVAAMGDIFKGALVAWVVATLIIGQLPQVSQAVAMLGAVSARLPFGPVLGVQVANAFTGLVGGTAGNATLNIRFFQRQGLKPAVAASSGILMSASGFIVQAILIVVAIVVTGSEFDIAGGDDGGTPVWQVVLIVAGLVGVAVVVFAPSLWRKIKGWVHTQVAQAWENLRGVLSNPRKAIQLFGGNAASQLLYAIVLGTALHAYGQSLPVLQLLLINCVASFIGGMAPVPGGMGVIETGLIAGFTASGIPEADAVAATFTARMCTSYLPPIWGWFALKWLRQHDYI
jgi:glycosyltransferase 2 family protein